MTAGAFALLAIVLLLAIVVGVGLFFLLVWGPPTPAARRAEAQRRFAEDLRRERRNAIHRRAIATRRLR